MSKFVRVEGYTSFEKIGEVIKNNKECNYYIAPKLMDSILNSNLQTGIDLNLEVVKKDTLKQMDLVAISVYNKVFETKAFRIEVIKFNGMQHKVLHAMENDYIAFGLDEDEEQFMYSELEFLD